MFQLGVKRPNLRVGALCAVVLAALLSSCSQRTAISPENSARAADIEVSGDLPVVVISAAREKPLRLAGKVDAKSATHAK
jgi:hypothetical protein